MPSTCVNVVPANHSHTDLTRSDDLHSEVVQIAESSTAVPLPPDCEELYSGEMDSETRKLLNELPEKIASGISNGLASGSQSAPVRVSVPDTKVDNWEWFKRIGSVLAVVVVISGANLYVISSEINKALTAPSLTLVKLDTELTGFEQRLKQVEARSLPAILSAPLPKNEAQQSQDLERRAEALDSAIQQKLPTYPDTAPAVSGFRINLAALQPRGVAFWKAAAGAINYQTFLVRQLTPFDETSCHVLPQNARVQDATIANSVFGGCEQQLDIGINWEGVTFNHSIIVYKGGELHLNNVTFEDCIFIVSFPENPPTPVQSFANYLLSAEKIPASLNIIEPIARELQAPAAAPCHSKLPGPNRRESARCNQYTVHSPSCDSRLENLAVDLVDLDSVE